MWMDLADFTLIFTQCHREATRYPWAAKQMNGNTARLEAVLSIEEQDKRPWTGAQRTCWDCGCQQQRPAQDETHHAYLNHTYPNGHVEVLEELMYSYRKIRKAHLFWSLGWWLWSSAFPAEDPLVELNFHLAEHLLSRGFFFFFF